MKINIVKKGNEINIVKKGNEITSMAKSASNKQFNIMTKIIL
jgi:hypothetical protein